MRTGIVCITLLVSMLLPVTLAFGADDCQKNVFFFFDNTESVYNYSETDIDGTLRSITEELIDDGTLMQDNFGFGLYLFNQETKPLIDLSKGIGDQRKDIYRSLEVLKDYDPKQPYNDYEVLFKEMKTIVTNNSLKGAKYPGYLFLLTDLLYDRNRKEKVTDTDINRIKVNVKKAYIDLIVALKANNYTLMVIYVENEPKYRDQKHFYVYKDVIEPLSNSAGGVVEVVQCSGKDEGLCSEPGRLRDKIRSKIDGGVTQDEEGVAILDIRESGCFLKIPLTNESCSEDIELEDISIEKIVVDDYTFFDGGSVTELFDTNMNPLSIDTLTLAKGRSMTLIAKISDKCPNLFKLEAFRNNKKPIDTKVTFTTDYLEEIDISLTGVNIKVGVAEVELVELWNVDLDEISMHSQCRMHFKPLNTKNTVPFDYYILVKINESMGCDITDSILVKRSEGLNSVKKVIGHNNGCFAADADSAEVEYIYMRADNGQELFRTPITKVGIKQTGFWPILIVSLLLSLLGAFILVGFRLISRMNMIEVNKQYVKDLVKEN